MDGFGFVDPRDPQAHYFDPADCFMTCARTWRDRCAEVLRALALWLADAVLQGGLSSNVVSIENVLIGLPFVCRVLHSYSYGATVTDHKRGDCGSHGPQEVCFVIDGKWGGAIYHGVERQGGVRQLYRTIFKFDAQHKVNLVRWVVQVVAAAYLQGCACTWPCAGLVAAFGVREGLLN